MGEHRTDLTEVMKERLKAASSENREKGDLNDDTRLISSWKEANSKERAILQELFDKHYHEWKAKSQQYIQCRYEVLGVFTKECIRNALGNLAKKSKTKAKSAAEGKIILFCSLLLFSRCRRPHSSCFVQLMPTRRKELLAVESRPSPPPKTPPMPPLLIARCQTEVMLLSALEGSSMLRMERRLQAVASLWRRRQSYPLLAALSICWRPCC